MIRALRYSGLAEVEWKRDPRDGRLKFLEVNARSWGWQSLSSQVVGPVGVLLHRQLCGDKPSPVLPRYGARWVKHITDVPVVLDLWRRGELSLGDYVRSLTGRVTGCEWDVRDPLPFVLQFLLVPYLIRRRGY